MKSPSSCTLAWLETNKACLWAAPGLLVASLGLWNAAQGLNTSFWSQKDLGSELSFIASQLGDGGQVT